MSPYQAKKGRFSRPIGRPCSPTYDTDTGCTGSPLCNYAVAETKVKLDDRILVDYCPINQSFEVPINDPSSTRNADYVRALTAWRRGFMEAVYLTGGGAPW